MLKNRQDACSTKINFSCGVGRMPTPERLIENGAIYSLSQKDEVLMGIGHRPPWA
jgi:hypothetical protein